MGRTAYLSANGSTLVFITIKDDDHTYFTKVKTMLDSLDALSLGRALLTEINNRGKNVVIAPTATPDSGNKCTSGGDAIFYRLVAAFRGATDISVRTELGRALMGAAKAGWTLDRIGVTLAGGLSPVTVRTVNNLTATTLITTRARQTVGDQIADLLEAVGDGRRQPTSLFGAPRGTHSVGHELVRFLRPWLAPGTGSGSMINFNPDTLLGCMGDKMRKRPPEIGLAHELCHAWRNAIGQRLFDDAVSCGLDDDEVMTTGFPPYQYEKFSENLFRDARGLPLRENYR
jgi:Effector protein